MEGLQAGQCSSCSKKRHNHKGRDVEPKAGIGVRNFIFPGIALQLLGRSLSAKLPFLTSEK